MTKRNDKDLMMFYAENLKRIRRSKNITQIELAERLKRTSKQIGKYETGKSMISLEMAHKIAIMLEVSIDQFTGYHPNYKLTISPGILQMIPEINDIKPEHRTLLEGQIRAFLDTAKNLK